MGAEVTNNEVTSWVTDSGIGMSALELENLFNIEKTSIASENVKKRKNGLGLLLCKDFVELNNGKIWAESKLGIGSIFRITLMKSNI
jgi:two-component system, sensor histidine kinase and response regulator